MDQPTVAQYVPFPSFAQFAAAGFDRTTMDDFVALMEATRASATDEQLRQSVAKATKWAAVDTGAIEGLYEVDRGFTFSVAAESAAWDNIHLVKGESAERAMKDALEGYEFVLDVATDSRPVTETWIKELHTVICASQDTYTVMTAAGEQQHELKKGTYKIHPNSPVNLASNTVHSYASVDDTSAEMHRLIDELNGPEFRSAHPVLQAAYAHYGFVCVHPFADGNGRVSRALASVYLYRSPGVPLVIFADQKPAYLDALEAADAGNYREFVQFISERAVDVVRMVAADMRRKPRPTAAERMTEVQRSLLGRGGLPHEEVDAMAGLLLVEFVKSLTRAVDQNPVSRPLRVNIQLHDVAVGISSGFDTYRHAPAKRSVQLVGTSAAPARAAVNLHFGVMIAKGVDDRADFAVVRGPGVIVEEALIRDLVPVVSPALTYRLDAAADEQVLELIDALIEEGAKSLRRAGYTTGS